MTFLDAEGGRPSKAVHIYTVALISVSIVILAVFTVLSFTLVHNRWLTLVMGCMTIAFVGMLGIEFREYRTRLDRWHAAHSSDRL